MPPSPFTIDHFGGLNFADDPTEVGATGATGGVDFDIDMNGRVRNRDGYTTLETITTTAVGGISGFETVSGLSQVVVAYTNGATKTYAAYSTAGGAAVSTAAPADATLNAAHWGDPTNDRMYIANGVDTVWRWTGAAFSQPAGMPIATFLTGGTTGPGLAGSAGGTRLVAANIVGTSVSRVAFSDAMAPETWTANNYVELAPGDGSAITGLATWQGAVFAFKRRRYFCFTGESIAGNGNPLFHYNEVDGYGALVPPVAGDEGVYFFDGRTVWVARGSSVPVRVSRAIEPFLQTLASTGSQSTSYAIDPAFLTSTRMSYSCGRLYMSVILVGGAAATIVYDPKIDAWMIWSIPMRFASSAKPSGSQLDTVFFQDSGGEISYFRVIYTDNGAPILWNYQSGLYDMGSPGQVKISLESHLVGSGTATLKVWTVGGAASNVNPLGGSVTMTGVGDLATGEGWLQQDFEGDLWTHVLQGTTATDIGRLQRLTHHISFVKPPGVW